MGTIAQRTTMSPIMQLFACALLLQLAAGARRFDVSDSMPNLISGQTVGGGILENKADAIDDSVQELKRKVEAAEAEVKSLESRVGDEEVKQKEVVKQEIEQKKAEVRKMEEEEVAA